MNIKTLSLLLLMIVFAGVFFSSCEKNKWTEYLVGSWSINSIKYSNHDIKKCLIFNALSLGRDNKMLLPSVGFPCIRFNDGVESGSFKIDEVNGDSAYVDIITGNHFFNGKCLFVKQSSTRYIVEMKSDSLYVLLYKIGYP